MLMPGSLCQSSSCPLLQRLISVLNEEADTKHEEGPLSVPALHLPKAIQRWLLPRKHRLGVVVTQSQANPPLPQMESDWGFSSYLCLHRRESGLPRLWAIPPGNGRNHRHLFLGRSYCSARCRVAMEICLRLSQEEPVVSKHKRGRNLGWRCRMTDKGKTTRKG